MPSMANNLIIFGTYWNERGWVEASLAQIDALNPAEVILCDGCFDPMQENKSTDGTREIIKAWCAERPHARWVEAVRQPKWLSWLTLLIGHNKASFSRLFTPGRWKSLVLWARNHPYRINQALTFQKMISMSTQWQAGKWFMTLDADQFYTDDMVQKIITYVNDADAEAGLLTGTERTFFGDFKQSTTGYEQRTYNNMPHRIYRGTTVVPTRGLVVDDWMPQSFTLKHALRNELYENKVVTKYVGEYHHYKFQPHDPSRLDAGYQLGDRKPPTADRTQTEPYTGKYPQTVKVAFKL